MNYYKKNNNNNNNSNNNSNGNTINTVNMIKTINVINYNYKFININLDEYIKCVNSFDIHMDQLAICKKFKITDINKLMLCSRTTINFLKALRGKTVYKKERNLLMCSNIGIQPTYTENIRKHIANIKWIIYINIKHTHNINQLNDDIIYYISMLSSLMLYFNELDLISTSENNNNRINSVHNTKYVKNISKQHTINEY